MFNNNNKFNNCTIDNDSDDNCNNPCGFPNQNISKHSIDFKCCKKNTLKSLYEVECFLSNMTKICKSIEFFKLFK